MDSVITDEKEVLGNSECLNVKSSSVPNSIGGQVASKYKIVKNVQKCENPLSKPSVTPSVPPPRSLLKLTKT